MATVGTRKFWKSVDGTAQQPVAILKNQGYLSITLHGAYYWSRGNLWQRLFGGVDRIALISQVTYKAQTDVVCTAVQDVRKVPSNTGAYLGVGRAIAVKVPATANALELGISISAVPSDNFDRILGVLNSDEVKQPLQLAPPVVGAVLAITNVVKRAFTDVNPENRLDAIYPGLISLDESSSPLQENKLVGGYLMVVATEKDNDDFLGQMDPAKLEVVGDGARYDGKPLPYTYVIYNIAFDPRRGVDQGAPWSQKLRSAMQVLNKIAIDQTKAPEVLASARNLWVEGSALLEADPNYVDDERDEITAKSFEAITKKYEQLTGTAPTVNALIDIAASPFAIDTLPRSVRQLAIDERPLDRIESLSHKYNVALGRAGLSWSLQD